MPVGLIANFTALKPRQVRECLLVLIQHNLVVYAESQEKTRIVTYYEINRPELLHRVLIPKVLHSSQDWFERDGALITQSLLTHGKLTITDCVADILKTSGVAPGKTTTQRKNAPYLSPSHNIFSLHSQDVDDRRGTKDLFCIVCFFQI
jgi:DNA-directed RNA polymerase III subunit RPC3